MTHHESGIPARASGTFAVRNGGSSSLRVLLEPWSDEIVLARLAAVEITFDGPSHGRIEIDISHERVAVGGWEGSILDFRTSNGCAPHIGAHLPGGGRGVDHPSVPVDLGATTHDGTIIVSNETSASLRVLLWPPTTGVEASAGGSSLVTFFGVHPGKLTFDVLPGELRLLGGPSARFSLEKRR